MATLREKDFIAERLLPLIGRDRQLSNKKITGFLSMTGYHYNKNLMVIGRAVNGWSVGIHPSQLRDGDFIRDHAERLYEASTLHYPSGNPDICPMSWVTDRWGADNAARVARETGEPLYNTARSAFWRVIRAVVDQLGIADVDNQFVPWSSHLVWSNLYKIAPAEGGNPGDILRNIQEQSCIELMKIEIETYQPKRILFLTDTDWAGPFIDAIHGNIQHPINQVLTQVRVHGNAFTDGRHPYYFVVASHPQGKPEAIWVNEVLQVFRAARIAC